MVNTCVVFGCNFSYSRRKIQGKEHVSMHAFPKRKALRDAWVKAIHRENWSPTNASGVCSQHFRDEDMDLTGQTRRLREGAVPSLFPLYPSYHQRNVTGKKLSVCQDAGDETLQVSCNSSSNCVEPNKADLSPCNRKFKEELGEENSVFPSCPSYQQKTITATKLPVCQDTGDETLQLSCNNSSGIADMSPRERKLVEVLRKKNKELMRAKKKIKVLQQKVRRKEKRIQMDRKVIDELLNNEILNEYSAASCSHTTCSVCG